VGTQRLDKRALPLRAGSFTHGSTPNPAQLPLPLERLEITAGRDLRGAEEPMTSPTLTNVWRRANSRICCCRSAFGKSPSLTKGPELYIAL
jgi:hypothetical protein